jgi:hypothetical protein
MKQTLPESAAERKNIPIVRGCLDYFPAALAAIAELSRIGNEQHNPGEPLHHARGKSTDHADCIVRHLMDRGTIDTDKIRHTTKLAWRALALLQEELEAAGAPMARGAKPASVAEGLADAKRQCVADGPMCLHTQPEGPHFTCNRTPGHSGEHVGITGEDDGIEERWL